MANMTSHERFKRMFEHREADRVPFIDGPWLATIERWHREGLPEDVPWDVYFDVDKTVGIGADNSPRYETQVIEETEEYRIETTRWGATMKNFKHSASTPEFLGFTVTTPDKWREAKARMVPSRDRVDWDYLKANYAAWREQGYWITGGGWFGFDVTHSYTVGTERLLMAMLEDPEWVSEMFNHFLDVNLALLDMIWDEGYTFDCYSWPDDMGYKYHQFFSLKTYRELLKPVQARAIEWAHRKGIFAELHSCGNVMPLVPEFVEIGLDGLNPLEVKAGMDPIALKQEHGDRLLLHGGINALFYNDIEAVEAQMREMVPVLKQGGGYICGSDHSVPSSISLKDFGRVVELAKELGSYD
ncbi:MAG: hypothetical protein GX100_13160 [candidate division WS1 bacterium]|jgi:uroporphyrinogen decarboxylase|nr:hypothetical protein [candidate division WS1 bacterium]